MIDPVPDTAPPTLEDVGRILALGRDLAAERSTDPHLLIHCHAGFSRSPAALALLVAQPGRRCQPRHRDRNFAHQAQRLAEFADRRVGRQRARVGGGSWWKPRRRFIANASSGSPRWAGNSVLPEWPTARLREVEAGCHRGRAPPRRDHGCLGIEGRLFHGAPGASNRLDRRVRVCKQPCRRRRPRGCGDTAVALLACLLRAARGRGVLYLRRHTFEASRRTACRGPALARQDSPGVARHRRENRSTLPVADNRRPRRAIAQVEQSQRNFLLHRFRGSSGAGSRAGTGRCQSTRSAPADAAGRTSSVIFPQPITLSSHYSIGCGASRWIAGRQKYREECAQVPPNKRAAVCLTLVFTTTFHAAANQYIAIFNAVPTTSWERKL